MTALTYFFETCYHQIGMVSVFQLLCQCCVESCVELDSEVQSRLSGKDRGLHGCDMGSDRMPNHLEIFPTA